MGSKTAKFDDATPVIWVTLADARKFADSLNRSPFGNRYAFYVPSDTEWLHAIGMSPEEAATNIDSMAWTMGNAKEMPQPVATRQENQFGLFDVIGNVWEWSDGEMMMGLSCSDAAASAAEIARAFAPSKPPEKNYKGGNVGFRIAASSR
jgi:formylglycine-generating enzyme required for sulfatase activity